MMNRWTNEELFDLKANFIKMEDSRIATLKNIGVELVQSPPTWTWPSGAEPFEKEKRPVESTKQSIITT